MNPVLFEDRLFAKMVLKFQINSVEDKKVMDYAFSNHDEGILYLSSKLNESEVRKIIENVKKNYQCDEICRIKSLGCPEIGFSKYKIGGKDNGKIKSL